MGRYVTTTLTRQLILQSEIIAALVLSKCIPNMGGVAWYISNAQLSFLICLLDFPELNE